MAEEKKDFRYIVRIANTDLDGSKPIYKALTKIKGVGFMFSNMVCSLAGINKEGKVGELSDADIKKISDVIKDPVKFNAPEWIFNRRKDVEDNVSKHLVSVDLDFTKDNDIKMMRKIRCYKGMRHSYGLPVRGQRTRSNFRKNKGKVHLGVKVKPGSKAGRV